MSNNYPYNYTPRREMFPSINPRDNVGMPDYATIDDDERRSQEAWPMGRKQADGASTSKRNRRRPLYRPVPVDPRATSRVIPRVADKYPQVWKPVEDTEEDELPSYSESLYGFLPDKIIPIPPERSPTRPRRVVRTRGTEAVKLPAIAPLSNQAVGFRSQIKDAPPKSRGGCLTNAQILEMNNKLGPNRARAIVRPNDSSSVTVQEETRLPTPNLERNIRAFETYMNRPPVRYPVQPYPNRYEPSSVASLSEYTGPSQGPSQYTGLSQSPSQYASINQGPSQPVTNVSFSNVSSPDLDAILHELL